MATTSELPPTGSQQSTSDLSDPPDSLDEEMSEIAVRMLTPPHCPDKSDNISPADCQPENMAAKSSPANSSGDAVPINGDEVAAEIQGSRRSARRRVPTKRAPIANPTPSNPPTKKLKVRSKKWDPGYVTQNSRSPLITKDLRAVLLHPLAWDLLTDEDKQEILAEFPGDEHILDAGTSKARPNIQSLQNDDSFRHDTEEYVSNLTKGMHDPQWLQDAWAAHGRRLAGEFDEYYIRKLEIGWEEEIPDEFKPAHLRSKPEEAEGSPLAGQAAEDEGATIHVRHGEAVANGDPKVES